MWAAGLPRGPPRPAVHSPGLHGSCGGGRVLAGAPRPATLGFPPISLTPGSVECPSWAGSHLVDLGQSIRLKYFAQLFTWGFLLVVEV